MRQDEDDSADDGAAGDGAADDGAAGGDGFVVRLVADDPALIEAVGLLRWREWGRPPEPVDPEFWIAVTGEESGRGLPATYAAVSPHGTVLGAVGLGAYDIEERRDVLPWVMGMVVEPAYRRRGVGAALLERLAGHAESLGYGEVWVATENAPAVSFYQACGWRLVETIGLRGGQSAAILHRGL